MQNPPPLPPQPLPPPVSTDNYRTFAMFCHLSAFAAFFVPLGNIWGPLVFWLVKKDESSEVDMHGKESLNFQLSITLYTFVFVILSLLLIGIPFLIGTVIYWFVATIIGSVRANGGELFHYPLSIRFFN